MASWLFQQGIEYMNGHLHYVGTSTDCMDYQIVCLHIHSWSYTRSIHDSKFKQINLYSSRTWWRYQMETFSALLDLCAGNSSVIGEFPAQRPATRSFDGFLISVWINAWVNNHEAGYLRRDRAHYDIIVMSFQRFVIISTHWCHWVIEGRSREH